MARMGARFKLDDAAGVMTAPAQIEILHVQEVALVETAEGLEVHTPHRQKRAADGADLNRLGGKRIARTIHVAQAHTQAFKPRQAGKRYKRAPRRQLISARTALFNATRIDQTPANNRGRRRGLERPHDAGDRAGRQDRVRIDEQEHIASGVARAQIAAGGEPDIAMAGQNITVIRQLTRNIQGIAVVDNDAVADGRITMNRVETVEQRRAGEIGDNDDADARHVIPAA